MSQKLVDSLSKASKNLMLREPFWGLYLIMLNKVWDKKVPTAGVSLRGINYQLSLNETWWLELNEKQQQGLLQHELMHISNYHLTDYHHLSDKKVANIAMDIAINQWIDPEFLPPGPQLPSSYPELELELKKGTQYYYDKLIKEGYGTPTLQNILDALEKGESMTTDGEGNSIMVPNHDWEEFEKLDEATQKLIKSQAEYIIREVAEQVKKSCGNIPGNIQDILDKLNMSEPPKFNWRGYLRRFVGGSVKTYSKSSKNKPNFRFIDNPGIKHKEKRRILLGVDVSGSVSRDELYEFLQEIHHIQKTGTEIMVAQFDSSISHLEKFDHKKPFTIFGRGGTSFHPVTDYYNKNKRLYNCLIIFTDGEAPAPEKCRGPVLWVHSSQSNINDDLKGHKIKLEL